jgi:hypothetical protein
VLIFTLFDSTTGLPITQIPFPSVSICADGINYEVLDAAIIQLFFVYRNSFNSTPYNLSATPIQLSKLFNKKYRNEVHFFRLLYSTFLAF